MGAVASKSDAKLAEALSLMYGRIAEATGDEMRANAFSEFALILLMESLEGPGFCVGRHSGKAFGAVSMRVAKDVGRRLETALGRFASRTATPGLFRLREWKSGLASYCLVEEGRIWILSGRFDDDDAADTLSTRSVLPSIEPEPGLLAFATCDESGVSPKMLTARVDGGSLVLKLEFTPSDLDRLPLPPQPSKDKTLR